MHYKYEPLDNGLAFKFSFTKLSSKAKESGEIPVVKMSKKGDFVSIKFINHNFSTKSGIN